MPLNSLAGDGLHLAGNHGKYLPMQPLETYRRDMRDIHSAREAVDELPGLLRSMITALETRLFTNAIRKLAGRVVNAAGIIQAPIDDALNSEKSAKEAVKNKRRLLVAAGESVNFSEPVPESKVSADILVLHQLCAKLKEVFTPFREGLLENQLDWENAISTAKAIEQKFACPNAGIDDAVGDKGSEQVESRGIHLRDVLTVLFPGNPDCWQDESAFERQEAAFNLVLTILRDEWGGSSDVDRLLKYVVPEALSKDIKRITSLDPVPVGGEYAEIDSQIRRIHNSGLTAKILEEVCKHYPDVAKATGLDTCMALPTFAPTMLDQKDNVQTLTDNADEGWQPPSGEDMADQDDQNNQTGRPAGTGDTDPQADRIIVQEWLGWHKEQKNKKNYQASFAQFAKDKHKDAQEVKRAVDRHRKRDKAKRHK